MSLLRSAATVSSLTLLSRITGLVRDVLIARAYGAGALTDAFWIAFRIPNLLRRLFAEGAFSQAFVPILGAVKTENGEERVQELLDRVAMILTLILMAVTAVGVLAAPWIVYLIASGLNEAGGSNGYDAAVTMTRIMFPYILCMSLVAFASGVLNTWRRFAIPAFTPVLLNVAMISASLWLAPRIEPAIYSLAIGVMAGGVAQLAVQWLALARLGVLPSWRRSSVRQAWQDPTVRRIGKQMLPAILGVSVAQISLLINTNIASWLPSGSVTWLSFADRLMEFPTALLGIALGTVLLPSLSRAHASQDIDTYSRLLDWGMRLTLLLGLPAALALAMLSEGMVATLFHYGEFKAIDVSQTQTAAAAYSVGLIGILSVKILAPGFYAKQDIRTPVKIAIFVLIITQVFNLALVPLLSHAGLALSIGLGACINAIALLRGLLKRGIYRPGASWTRYAWRMPLGLAAMAAILYSANQHIDWIALQTTPWMRVLLLAGVAGAAAFSYFAVLFLSGMRPSDFRR